MASVVINEKICDYLIFFKSDKIGIIIHTELCVRVNDCHLVELLLWTGTGTCVCLCVCGGTHLESRLNGSVGRVLSPSSIRSGDRPCWHRWHTHTPASVSTVSTHTHTQALWFSSVRAKEGGGDREVPKVELLGVRCTASWTLRGPW